MILLLKTLNYFNDLQNWNFAVLWLNWTQTIEMNQNQTFFHGSYSSLTTYLFYLKYLKILKYFNDFQNRNFSVLWIKWTQTVKTKQN